MKKIIYCLILLVMGLTLAGCGNNEKKVDEEGFPVPQTEGTDGQDTLDLERHRGSND